MSDPQSKPEIIDALRRVQAVVDAAVRALPPERFEQGSAAAWSPADYLKHLLLSNKPFAKALTLPPAALARRFGEVTHTPMPYAEIAARYRARLDEGARAEDYEAILPTAFRVPEGAADLQAALLDVWNEAHERMVAGLAGWTEADLDRVRIMHPALGSISVREMLFFTIYHNTLHGDDIRKAGG